MVVLAAPGYLAPKPAPVDNPLKGLVPYQGQAGSGFPCSMEFSYLPVNAVVKGEKVYDWSALEGLLNDVASRGRQTVFRFFLEYPGQASGMPQHLKDMGVKVTEWTYGEDAGRQQTFTPDYSDPRIRLMLKQFVAALGAKYDGDPRIGFMTAGLLGSWGEWHTWPRNELWASKEVQTEVLDSLEAAFSKTPVLLRYPAGDSDPAHARTTGRPFGYHDDSFAWATLATSDPGKEWFFLNLMVKAGASSTWQKHPIGGEIRPEAWGRVFDENPGRPEIQSFEECVRQTRATWLMDSGMFGSSPPPEGRKRRAMEQVRKMGYTLSISKASLVRKGRQYELAVTVASQGAAPFYAAWPLEAVLLDEKGQPVGGKVRLGVVSGILPGQNRSFRGVLPVAAGARHAAVAVLNPMPGGRPLAFANAGQNRHAAGWMTVADTASVSQR